MDKLVQFKLKIGCWYSMAQKTHHQSPPKNKKCANRSQRTKNANSVSRQTNQYKASLHSYRRNLHFYQIHGMNAKGYSTPVLCDAFHYLISLARL